MENLDFTYYTFTDAQYYETPNRFRGGDAYEQHLRSLLPDSWSLSRFDTWLKATAMSDDDIQLQGFKIHVSATFDQGKAILDRVVPICVKAGVTFKIAADPELHRFLNSKRYGRGGAGKFMTIYPTDDGFKELIARIYDATSDLEGPYILSDKRYREEGVTFYRYGGFKLIYQLAPDGAKVAMIRNAEGDLVKDERQPYFHQYDWVEDPFPGSNEEEAGDDDSGLLNQRYEVQEALGFTNTGGVYRALDHTTGKEVVIKEARPHTITWMGPNVTIEAQDALRREHKNLLLVKGVPGIPQALDFFQEWEHLFLVTEFFDGIPLTNFRATSDFIVMTFLDDDERVRGFCREWLNIARRLLNALDAAHQRGLIVGDISAGNVLIDRDTGEIALIDLEGAFPVQSGDSMASFSVKWFNPGFRHPDRRDLDSLEPFDDYYGCGMLLYSLICPIQNLFECDKNAPVFRILDHFVEGGLPSQIRSAIGSLLEGDAVQARQEMDDLEKQL